MTGNFPQERAPAPTTVHGEDTYRFESGREGAAERRSQAPAHIYLSGVGDRCARFRRFVDLSSSCLTPWLDDVSNRPGATRLTRDGAPRAGCAFVPVGDLVGTGTLTGPCAWIAERPTRSARQIAFNPARTVLWRGK